MPAGVNSWNLEVGKSVYNKLLGIKPTIWYVNEQAYSMSMVDHYVNIGAKAIINEWNNAGSIHSEWPKEYRFFPQVVSGHQHKIPVIWNDSITFQKFQRYAHNDLDLNEYLDYIQSLAIPNNGVHCLYGNDAETFDFRPGRFMTEAKVEIGEWDRINALYKHLSNDHQFIFPSEILNIDNQFAFHSIELQTSDVPIPVKKQPKYNVTRWALTGRDNCGINSICYSLFIALKNRHNNGDGVSFDDKKALLYAFSSDFRTHITEKRWVKYLAFLNELTNKYALDKNRVMTLKWNNQSFAIESSRSAPVQWINYQQTNYINDINHRLIEIRTPTMSVIF